MNAVLCILVFMPFAAAALLPLLKKRNKKAVQSMVIAVSAVLFGLSLLLFLLPDGEAALGVFGGMGLHFSHDGSLRTIMTSLTAFMWLFESIYAPEYFADDHHVNRFYLFYLLTQGALFGVFLAGDLFTLFVFFEIMTVASYFWIVHTETTDAIAVSKTYIYISLIGGMVMLMGIFLLYYHCGSLEWDAIAASGLNPSLRYVCGGCLLFGFGVKAGMFPLHIWLPVAHPVAPAPASALLSGILLKSGIFGILLTTQILFSGDVNWGNFLLLIAVVTMLLGGLLGIFSADLKRTLACSSMSQIGFILFGIACISLLGEETVVASAGVTLHIVNHALIKLVLFTLSGIVYRNLHSITYNRIRGYGRKKKGLLAPFLLCACSIAGIPGFSGYISKTLLHESIVEYYAHQALNGHPIMYYKTMEWLFLIAGACTLAYMLKLFYVLFIAKAPSEKEETKPYTRRITLTLLMIPSVLMPLFGIFAYHTFERIFDRAAEFFGIEQDLMVHYFSFECIRGAVISISAGVGIFLISRLLHHRRSRIEGREVFLSLWPGKLNMEYRFYRPLLRFLNLTGTIIARSFETIGNALFYGVINLIFYRAPAKVKPDTDRYFGAYGKERVRSIADESFSSDLLLAAFGIAAILIAVVFMALS